MHTLTHTNRHVLRFEDDHGTVEITMTVLDIEQLFKLAKEQENG